MNTTILAKRDSQYDSEGKEFAEIQKLLFVVNFYQTYQTKHCGCRRKGQLSILIASETLPMTIYVYF